MSHDQPTAQLRRRPQAFMVSVALALDIHSKQTAGVLLRPRQFGGRSRQITLVLKAFGAAAIIACTAALPSAAMAANATGNGEAIIVTPTSFFLVEDMSFGTIVPGVAPGSVTIDATSGARSVSGGIAALAGTHDRARFVAGGTEGQTVDLTLSAPPSLSDGNGNSMPISSLVVDGPTTRTFGPEMAIDIYVGGTLEVDGDQAPGLYSGTFTLTIEYS